MKNFNYLKKQAFDSTFAFGDTKKNFIIIKLMAIFSPIQKSRHYKNLNERIFFE